MSEKVTINPVENTSYGVNTVGNMSMMIKPIIEDSWRKVLEKEFQSNYFKNLKEFLIIERKKHIIYPPASRIFAAFNYTPFDKVKVVIIGQDPYHGEGQANGLCFSVKPGVKIPPSLQNIFKEIQSDLGKPFPITGDLGRWAEQGVLLLNATLTVRSSVPGSHQNKGWETFTDAVIKIISEEKQHVVFLLWGAYAQKKIALIDSSKHCVLQSAHPSPFSADRGFFGNKHFSKANAYLKSRGIKEIDW